MSFLHRVIRGCQPSFHSLPIDKYKYHCRCSKAELLIEAAAVVVIAAVAVAFGIATAEAVDAEAGAVIVAGGVEGGMVAGHGADKLAFVAVIVAADADADAGVDAGAGAVVVDAVAVVDARKDRWKKGQWLAGLGPGLVPKTCL